MGRPNTQPQVADCIASFLPPSDVLRTQILCRRLVNWYKMDNFHYCRVMYRIASIISSHINKGEAQNDRLPSKKENNKSIIHCITERNPAKSPRKTNRTRWSTNDTSNWSKAILVQMAWLAINERPPKDINQLRIQPMDFLKQNKPKAATGPVARKHHHPYTWRTRQSMQWNIK